MIIYIEFHNIMYNFAPNSKPNAPYSSQIYCFGSPHNGDILHQKPYRPQQ